MFSRYSDKQTFPRSEQYNLYIIHFYDETTLKFQTTVSSQSFHLFLHDSVWLKMSEYLITLSLVGIILDVMVFEDYCNPDSSCLVFVPY